MGQVHETGEQSNAEDFAAAIKDDEGLRRRLAINRASGVFYSGLDLGDSFDVALDRALGMAIVDKEYLDGIAETGTVPEGSAYEEGGVEAIAAMEARERQATFDPSLLRKKVAGWILRQEARPGKYIVNLSLRRMKLAKVKLLEEENT